MNDGQKRKRCMNMKKTQRKLDSLVTMVYPEGFDSYIHNWVVCQARDFSTLEEIFPCLLPVW